jgi:ubiquinone/menaquinone biosynthesis C-methylase UbiE
VDKAPSGNQFLNPQEILSRIGVHEKMTVGDLGSGSGYFSFQAAQMVGQNGKVYAVDVLKNALSALKSKAEFLGIKNITPIWSNLEILGAAKRIKSDTLDIALLVNILHQSKKHRNILVEARRMLKKGGLMLVVDWKRSAASFAPHESDLVKPEHVLRIAEELGFHTNDRFDAGIHHYALLFQK